MSSTWAFKEAEKILKRIEKTGQKEVVFSTGFGPSGLPHIGTFGEIKRTEMVIKAFQHLTQDNSLKCVLKIVSDDMDGLRKVPDNVPNHQLMIKNLGKPLIDIPDPFEEYGNFAEHMNAKLIDFANRFLDINFEFVSSSKFYRSGYYNEKLLLALEKYDAIMQIMLPSLGEERKKNYSPFLPICEITGKVLQTGVASHNVKDGTIDYYDDNGSIKTTKITDGMCKLQWKPDWGMRWSSLKVDYEMHGKDLQPSAFLSSKICLLLGRKKPELYQYELFLDQYGKKISKSKGNGLAIEEWLRYSTSDSLSFYMYQNPQRAKRLSLQLIPNITDEYLKYLCNYKFGDVSNPVWYLYYDDNKIPTYKNKNVTFSMLLNLAKACNPEKESILWNFIEKYGYSDSEKILLTKMIKSAMNYYNDFIKNKKEYIKPDVNFQQMLLLLKDELINLEEYKADNIQNIFYSMGKKIGYTKDNMKDFFKQIYKILLGSETGPRMGSFCEFYGKKQTIEMITKVVNSE
ncbi:lysine--tRNA ligase [Anaplasmataceae bacterium AB001_6]|nr:lysine--tRNA ligase [Anaplasmataceae bacterium AB001_6]